MKIFIKQGNLALTLQGNTDHRPSRPYHARPDLAGGGMGVGSLG